MFDTLTPAIRPLPPAGPACHFCGQPAETQWQRHATQAEYDRVEGNLRPIDGRVLITGFSCADHHIEPFCDHTPPPAQPCPACRAAPGTPCAKPDGTPRIVDHADRTTPGLTVCAHAHRENCAGYSHCDCAENDLPPARTPGAPPPRPSRTQQLAAIQAASGAEIDWMRKLMIESGHDPFKAAELARIAYGQHRADFDTNGSPS